MADLPPLNALKTFLYAAETQSFKRAAERLFVTQAAVSHQIRLLEDTLETQLFQRMNREVRLTPEGMRLLPYVRSGFRSLKNGVDQLKEETTPNRLTLSVSPAFASSWLVHHLKDFQQQFPEIHVNIRPSTALEDFSSAEVDLAIRFGLGQYDGLKSQLLIRDAMIVVAAPELIGTADLSLELLKTLPLLEDVSRGSVGWHQWLEEQGCHPDDFRIALTIEDSRLVIDAAANGQGVGLVRQSLAQELIRQKRLIQLMDSEIPTPFSYYLVAPDAHFDKGKNKIFIDWLQSALEQSFMSETLAYYGS